MASLNWKPFIYGGMASIVAEFGTFPIDLTKTRLQVQGQSQYTEVRYRGMFHALFRIGKEEGIRALYSGISPALLRQASYGTIKIGTYNSLKRLFVSRPEETTKKKAQVQQSFHQKQHSSTQGPSASRPQCCGPKELKHGSMRGSKHTVVSSFSDSSSDLQERRSTELDVLQEDSDTDLSETERLPVSHSSRIPPQLELRPEVMEADILSSHHHRPRQAQGGFDFPDFLPPPFNSWSLAQLAVFYNVEGRAAARPRPVGPLEKYLERLLQLEWHQIQTAQEESGKLAVSEVMSGCRSAAAATTSRLSSPKCILQCQRAFPLSFLSSLASHSTLLSGCACTPCQIRYSSCSSSCCRSIHSLSRPFRLSPMLERSSSSSRKPTLLPKRSYSESRVLSSERRCSSPGRTNSYLRRMQASGNMRNPIQGATSRPHSSVRDSGDHVGKADGMDGRMGAVRRSGSEQRRGGAERQQNGSEKRRSGSECRKGRSERRRDFKEREIKPDAVTAIMDNLPGPKSAPIRRPNRTKQVEFVT